MDIMAAASPSGNGVSFSKRKPAAITAAKETEKMDLFVLALGALFFAVAFGYARLCDRL